MDEKNRLYEKLTKLPIVKKVYKSEGNFLFTLFDEAKKIQLDLAEKWIIIRHINLKDYPYIKEWLRITIWSREENDKLIELLS